MKTHVRVMAAALIVLGLATGCARSTPGTVAMTTEPGPPLTSPSRPSPTSIPGLPRIPIPNIPIPGLPRTDLPEVPAPPNALTMTCKEFNGLDDATRLAVIKEILAQHGSVFRPDDSDIALTLAAAMCTLMPKSRVSQILLGETPP